MIFIILSCVKLAFGQTPSGCMERNVIHNEGTMTETIDQDCLMQSNDGSTVPVGETYSEKPKVKPCFVVRYHTYSILNMISFGQWIAEPAVCLAE
jgi:hypothetical protein